MNNLCIGLRYEFSVYIANIIKSQYTDIKPNVKIRTATSAKTLLARLATGDIPEYSSLTWAQYGMSFIALRACSAANNGTVISIKLSIVSLQLISECFIFLFISYQFNSQIIISISAIYLKIYIE